MEWVNSGGLALIRLAAALLVLSLASPALALPLSYSFVATNPELGSFSGTFTYDTEDPLIAAVVTSFVAPWFPHPGLIDWAHLPTWPGDPDAFPVVSGGVGLDLNAPPSFEGAQLRTGLAYYDLSGCEPGTPIFDCPDGTVIGRASLVLYDVQIVPEPSAAAALLLAATTLLATGSCRLRR